MIYNLQDTILYLTAFCPLQIKETLSDCFIVGQRRRVGGDEDLCGR